MSLETPTRERPAPAKARLPFPEGWTPLAQNQRVADQYNWPTAATTDALYVYGGATIATGPEVFSTSNGVPWDLVYGDWTPREWPSGAAFRGQLWLTGGNGFSDTWTATDPAHWTSVDDGAGWGPRYGHTLIAYKDNLYLIAGFGPGGTRADVWVWNDQAPHWRQISDGQFTPRGRAVGAVVGGKMVLVGGENRGAVADAAISGDGQTWRSVPLPFSPRSNMAGGVIGDTLYVVGGMGAQPPQVYATRDGEHWTLADSKGPWDQIFQHAVGVGPGEYGEHLIVAGGLAIQEGEIGANRDVWGFKSRQLGWSVVGQAPVMAAVDFLTVARLGGRDYAIGLGSQRWYFSSPDGVAWNQAPTDLPFRREAQLVSDGKTMWVSGGTDVSGQYLSDIRYTTDGEHWSPPMSAPGWPVRKWHGMAFFKGKVWILSGQGYPASPLADVWSCDPAEGVWKPQQPKGLEGRNAFATAVFGGKMWILGGSRGGGQATNDTFSSDDGITWTKRTAQWSPRLYPGAAVVGDSLYVFGGYAGQECVDVWATQDGITWTPVDPPIWRTLRYFGVSVRDDAILVFGGVNSQGGPDSNVYRCLPVQAPAPAG